MEITPLGHNRSLITLVYSPQQLIIDPRIVDGTRWILLHPRYLVDLDQHLQATTRRAEGISGSTWQRLNAPYLLKPHLTTRHDATTIHQFGRMASAVTLIHTNGERMEPQRVGSSSIVLCGRLSFLWLRDLIQQSPRRTQSAIPYLKQHGIRPSSVFMREMFSQIPALREN